MSELEEVISKQASPRFASISDCDEENCLFIFSILTFVCVKHNTVKAVMQHRCDQEMKH